MYSRSWLNTAKNVEHQWKSLVSFDKTVYTLGRMTHLQMRFVDLLRKLWLQDVQLLSTSASSTFTFSLEMFRSSELYRIVSQIPRAWRIKKSNLIYLTCCHSNVPNGSLLKTNSHSWALRIAPWLTFGWSKCVICYIILVLYYHIIWFGHPAHNTHNRDSNKSTKG